MLDDCPGRRREAPAVRADHRRLIGAGDLESVRVSRSVYASPEVVAAYKRQLAEAGRDTAA
ncbi:MAG: hypothetical protein ACRDN0_00200 [Trebonia sp.]